MASRGLILEPAGTCRTGLWIVWESCFEQNFRWWSAHALVFSALAHTDLAVLHVMLCVTLGGVYFGNHNACFLTCSVFSCLLVRRSVRSTWNLVHSREGRWLRSSLGVSKLALFFAIGRYWPIFCMSWAVLRRSFDFFSYLGMFEARFWSVWDAV